LCDDVLSSHFTYFYQAYFRQLKELEVSFFVQKSQKQVFIGFELWYRIWNQKQLQKMH
jgi:hypothetical protein